MLHLYEKNAKSIDKKCFKKHLTYLYESNIILPVFRIDKFSSWNGAKKESGRFESFGQ